MTFTQKYKKELKLAAVIAAIIFIGSYAGILPFAITTNWHGVYTAQWAGLECANSGQPGQTLWTNLPLAETSYHSGSYRIATSYPCPFYGGCTVEVTNILYQFNCGDPGSATVSFTKDQDINSKEIVNSHHSSGIYCSSNTITSYRAAVYPTSVYILKKTSGPADIKLGWLDETENCWLSQASAELVDKLRDSASLGDFTLNDVKIDPYKANVQLPPGKTVNYMVGWELKSTNTYDYNGQDVRCVPREGLYSLYPTDDSDTFIQGELIASKSTLGGEVCCGQDQENVCGYQYHCKDYRCVEGALGGECDSDVPYISQEQCILEGGLYYRVAPSKCVSDTVIPGDKVKVSCCPGYNACPTGQYCDVYSYTCVARTGKQSVSAGHCANVVGETYTGAARDAREEGGYITTPCPSDTKCCYGDQKTEVGTCLTTCLSTNPSTPTPGPACTYDGIVGALEKAFGLGCEWWNAVFAIILLIVIIAIIIIMIKIIRK